MFYELIKEKMFEWYNSDECKINNIIKYIENQNKLRDAQIESIKMYLFFKIYCNNLPLAKLFSNGCFLKNINLNELEISNDFREFLLTNKSARQLYEIAISNEEYNGLKKEIEKNYINLDFSKIFSDIFHGISYANYIYSLPMGAGKTYLMSAFIYINLYFAINEPYNRAFAHNFIILAPSGLKSSIIPSLKKIKDFDVTWIFPEPMASVLKKEIKYEILDEVKTDKKSNKIKNPNVAKIAQYQPYKDMRGVVLLTNAEKVILNKVKIENEQLKIDFEKEDIVGKVANELRETINKIPNMAIYIDEVHHVADEEIKLNKVVEYWSHNNSINEVVGFSGTPYLDKAEEIIINSNLSIKNSDISNTIYYYPLTSGINNFLKKPTIIASTNNNSLSIIEEGLTEFFNRYKDVSYGNLTSKLAIYCGNIKNLEENVYPFVSEFVLKNGMNPSEVILKYHGGNKDYSISKDNELEFESLNNPTSKKRIVLLVGIGKEGWDCSSLTGVILSQKGDCPIKMVLQTSCRCLRQVNREEKETALIYLNKDNENLLSTQLKKSQHATIKELENGTINDECIARYNRMNHLNVPNVDYYKMNIKYTDEIKKEANVIASINNILKKLPELKENVIVKELDLNGNETLKNINEIILGDNINYREWLLSISKESFNFISYQQLKEYDDELTKIYNKITIDNKKFNLVYNHSLIKSLIRQSFYDKKTLNIEKEEIPESASILSIQDIPSIVCDDQASVYPKLADVQLILDKDDNRDINITQLSPEEFMKKVIANPELAMQLNSKESKEVKYKDKSFHYLPYVFNQSLFEKQFLNQVLSMNKFIYSDLEIYYNGDHNISNFRIECFKVENKIVKKVGLYTPDFLIIKRKNNNIEKMMIIETKGKGYSEQQEFIDRRKYVEEEFVKNNNKKYGYRKFDYFYIEDNLTNDEIFNKINNEIDIFFKEGK